MLKFLKPIGTEEAESTINSNELFACSGVGTDLEGDWMSNSFGYALVEPLLIIVLFICTIVYIVAVIFEITHTSSKSQVHYNFDHPPK